MTFDGFTLAAITQELKKQLLFARVDRIFQPEPTEIHLILRQPGQSFRLLISAHASHARMHLTLENKENPAHPPLFCMVLRKHLEGGRLVEITQDQLERVLTLHIESLDELGDLSRKILVCELMGKHSNIILYTEKNGLILDGIRRFSHALSRHREVLPGKPYIAPPPQNKLDLHQFNPDEFLEKIWTEITTYPLQNLSKSLVRTLSGVSPQLAREILFRANLAANLSGEECGEYELNQLSQTLAQMQQILQTGAYTPTLIVEKNPEGPPGPKDPTIEHWLRQPNSVNLVAYSVISLMHLRAAEDQAVSLTTCNELLDSFFQIQQRQAAWKEGKRKLLRTVEQLQEKAYRKLALRGESLSVVQEADTFRLYGELLMTNLSQISQISLGTEEVTVENLFQTNSPAISIPLNPLRSPLENAQDYFRKYNKARQSFITVKSHYEKIQAEVAYLESVAQALDLAETLGDLADIRYELVSEGYLRPTTSVEKQLRKPTHVPVEPGKAGRKKNHKPGKTKKPAAKGAGKSNTEPSIPLSRVYTSDGFEIIIGKNNRQNDFLTQRVARKNDLWLHVKDLPGSHVVLRVQPEKITENRNQEKKPLPEGVTATALEEAALLAAFFSKARYSNAVPVDYTRKQNVRKPKGAKPGYVIYSEQQTLFVTPSAEKIQALFDRLEANPATEE